MGEGYYNRYNKTLGRCVTRWYSLKADWWGTEKVEDHILCAKNPSKNTSTCQGDSGGPLTVKQNDQHFLVGITQSGYGCGLDGSPKLLVKVVDPVIRNWIDTEIA